LDLGVGRRNGIRNEIKMRRESDASTRECWVDASITTVMIVI